MSATPIRFDAAAARSISAATDIVIVNKADGKELERVTVLRYAGHYRTSAVDAFVVRNLEGKKKVRSENDLGLTETSNKVAYLADSYSASPAA